MDFLRFIRFFSFIVYCFLIVFVLWKDPKSKLNRVCAAILTSLIIWVFADFFILDNGTSRDTAILFTNIAAIGWCSVMSLFLWFALIFSEKKKIIQSKFFYPLLFILPALFIYMQWTGFLTIPSRNSFGWLFIWPNALWPYLFYIYYLSFVIGALYIIIRFKNKTKELIRKRQANIIISSILIPLVLGSLTDVLLPNLNIFVPPVANLIMLIWAAGLVIAIVKYKLMTITPAIAAEKIISIMADGLILLDMQGYIIMANVALINLSGYREDEIQNKSIQILLKESNSINLLLTEAVRNREIILKTKKGENIPVLFSSSFITDDAGRIAGIVCIAKDITERKQAEEKYRKLNDEIQQQAVNLAAQTEELHNQAENLKEVNELLMDKQRLIEMQSMQLHETNKQLSITNATKDKFFSIIAHDLRNPFTSILGFSEILLQAYDKYDDTKRKQRIDIIHQSAVNIHKLLENLLQWSQSQTGNIEFDPEEFYLGELIDNNIVLLDNLLQEKEIQISCKNIKDEKVYADKNMINTIIRNLINNAVKFCEKGEITIELQEEGAYYRLLIKDTGIGMIDEQIDTLFKIVETKSTTGTRGELGTGLGLILCKEFVEKNGGTLGVKSAAGKGSTFFFTIPKNRNNTTS